MIISWVNNIRLILYYEFNKFISNLYYQLWNNTQAFDTSELSFHHLWTETSSYSTSERLFFKLTLSIFSFDFSIFPHLSTSSLRCSLLTLAWQFLRVMTAPSLIKSSYSFFAKKTAHPYWSPTRTSACLIMVPSYRLLSFFISILWTYVIWQCKWLEDMILYEYLGYS